jgi:hypothetical protein
LCNAIWYRKCTRNIIQTDVKTLQYELHQELKLNMTSTKSVVLMNRFNSSLYAAQRNNGNVVNYPNISELYNINHIIQNLNISLVHTLM